MPAGVATTLQRSTRPRASWSTSSPGKRHLDLVLLGHGAQFCRARPELTADIREGQGKIFSEDLEMLERQQQNLLGHHPESDTSIWYFWGMAQFCRADEPTVREGQGKIFSEDLEMLERQQQNLLANPGRNLLKLNIDAGGVQSRKVLERVIAKACSTAATDRHQRHPCLRSHRHDRCHRGIP